MGLKSYIVPLVVASVGFFFGKNYESYTNRGSIQALSSWRTHFEQAANISMLKSKYVSGTPNINPDNCNEANDLLENGFEDSYSRFVESVNGLVKTRQVSELEAAFSIKAMSTEFSDMRALTAIFLGTCQSTEEISVQKNTYTTATFRSFDIKAK